MTGRPDPFVRDPLAGKLPVTVITGFLGSGKTTLIGHLLRHPDMQRVAVVINEVGEIGIDHDLVAMVSENVSLLANGCLCCVVRTDLQETLRGLFGQRRAGQIPDFDRVLIETSGLADPAPAVQTLATDTMLASQYRLDGVVTLVDVQHGASQREHSAEWSRQVALADLILLTKDDLADAAEVARVRAGVRAVNATASMASGRRGEVSPASLMGLGLGSARGEAGALRFLGRAADPATGEGEDEVAYLPSRLAGTRHESGIRTSAQVFEQPFDWAGFSTAMSTLMSLRGPDLLRIKGIVNVEGAPVVVQAVQHVMYPPVTLDRWPSDDRRTRLVCITRDIPSALVRGLFDAIAAFRA